MENILHSITLWYATFFDYQVWGWLLVAMLAGSVISTLVTRSMAQLGSGTAPAFLLIVWLNRRAIAAVLGVDLPPSNDLHMPTWLLIACCVFVVGGVASVWRSSAENAVPKIEQSPAEDAKPDNIGWLRTVAQQLPSTSSAVVVRITQHVVALQEIGANLTADSPALTAVNTIIGKDMRDLIVRYRQVELARKFLPAMSSAGDYSLLGALTRIEASVVQVREDVAAEAVKELAVETRYIELKHEKAAN